MLGTLVLSNENRLFALCGKEASTSIGGGGCHIFSYNISNNIHVLIRKEAANHEDSQISMDETFVKERIGQLVADSGKSEKRISKDLGRSVGYIQSLTSGKALPSMPMLFQICEYFNIEPKDFFDPNIPCPPTIQKIRSYACHMEKDSLVTLERLSKRLCSTGQSKTNESCDSRNIHEKI